MIDSASIRTAASELLLTILEPVPAGPLKPATARSYSIAVGQDGPRLGPSTAHLAVGHDGQRIAYDNEGRAHALIRPVQACGSRLTMRIDRVQPMRLRTRRLWLPRVDIVRRQMVRRSTGRRPKAATRRALMAANDRSEAPVTHTAITKRAFARCAGDRCPRIGGRWRREAFRSKAARVATELAAMRPIGSRLRQ